VITISNSVIGGKLSLNTLKDCLSNEEAHRKEMSADIDHALFIEGIGQSKSKEPKGKRKCNYRSQSKGRATCWKRGKLGISKSIATYKSKDKGTT